MNSLEDLRKQMIQDPKEKFVDEPSLSNATSCSNLEDTYPSEAYLATEKNLVKKNNYFNSEHEYRFDTDLIVASKDEVFRDSWRNSSTGKKSSTKQATRNPGSNKIPKNVYTENRDNLGYRIGKISQEFLISESGTIQSDTDKYLESSESIVVIKNKIKGFYNDTRGFDREI